MDDTYYTERTQLLAYIAATLPSHIRVDPDAPDWPVLCIHGPAGQMAWHIAPADMDVLKHVPRTPRAPDAHLRGTGVYTCVYDGHTDAEKYERLARCAFACLAVGHRLHGVDQP